MNEENVYKDLLKKVLDNTNLNNRDFFVEAFLISYFENIKKLKNTYGILSFNEDVENRYSAIYQNLDIPPSVHTLFNSSKLIFLSPNMFKNEKISIRHTIFIDTQIVSNLKRYNEYIKYNDYSKYVESVDNPLTEASIKPIDELRKVKIERLDIEITPFIAENSPKLADSNLKEWIKKDLNGLMSFLNEISPHDFSNPTETSEMLFIHMVDEFNNPNSSANMTRRRHYNFIYATLLQMVLINQKKLK